MSDRLRIVSSSQREIGTVRDRVDAVIAARRAAAIEVMERTLVYYASVGAKRIFFEEIPGIGEADADYVLSWLVEEGFEVCRPRLAGRIYVVIHP